MSCGQLARELEVARRTILRDVDALTEAGLPIIVHRGNRGGVELGFNYRTRLTGLSADEAEAMALILSRPVPELDALGLSAAGERARSKMLESFPDGVRSIISEARLRFRYARREARAPDPRIAALADAIRRRSVVRIHAHSPAQRVIHPVALVVTSRGWSVIDAREASRPLTLSECGDINISARTFSVDDSL